MTISVVIRAFNEGKHIGRLLYGITQQTLRDVEIILVDSGSTDKTLEIAAQYPVKIVQIQPEEFTFGRSLNRGIAAASGEIVVITSAHCYPVYPDWLEKLSKPFQNKNVALAYGRQIAGETNYYSEHQFFHKYFPENSVSEQGHPYSHNANAAIRRILWDENPYNELLTGLEDLAWSSWALEEGYTIDYVAEAEVIHQHDETLPQVYKRYKREAIAMKQILPESCFTLWHLLYMWSKTSFLDLMQARREGVLLRHFWSVICYRLMQYWGTYRGFHFGGKVDAKLHRAFYYPPNILDRKFSKPRVVKPIEYAGNENDNEDD
jgi:rhamnosyltransferase